MAEHKFEFRVSAVESYHASSVRSAVPSAIAVTTLMLLFVTLDGPAFAQEIDPASALRGSLGVSLADLSISNHFGALSFFLNGVFALLSGAMAVFLVARTGRDRSRAVLSKTNSLPRAEIFGSTNE